MYVCLAFFQILIFFLLKINGTGGSLKYYKTQNEQNQIPAQHYFDCLQLQILWVIRDIRKVRKRQYQYPEFGHTQGEIL
jgi:hypothetical protein